MLLGGPHSRKEATSLSGLPLTDTLREASASDGPDCPLAATQKCWDLEIGAGQAPGQAWLCRAVPAAGTMLGREWTPGEQWTLHMRGPWCGQGVQPRGFPCTGTCQGAAQSSHGHRGKCRLGRHPSESPSPCVASGGLPLPAKRGSSTLGPGFGEGGAKSHVKPSLRAGRGLFGQCSPLRKPGRAA